MCTNLERKIRRNSMECMQAVEEKYAAVTRSTAKLSFPRFRSDNFSLRNVLGFDRSIINQLKKVDKIMKKNLVKAQPVNIVHVARKLNTVTRILRQLPTNVQSSIH